jgi:hypothetical protein
MSEMSYSESNARRAVEISSSNDRAVLSEATRTGSYAVRFAAALNPQTDLVDLERITQDNEAFISEIARGRLAHLARVSITLKNWANTCGDEVNDDNLVGPEAVTVVRHETGSSKLSFTMSEVYSLLRENNAEISKAA